MINPRKIRQKVFFLKFFSIKTKLILGLVFFVIVVSGGSLYFLNNSQAYPFIEADEYKVLDDPRYAVSGDFNGDGELDLATVNFGSSQISVTFNNGDGTFIQPSSNFSSGNPATSIGPLGIATADFDSDTDLDLAVVNYISGDIRIFDNDGSGNFTLDGTSYITSYSGAISNISVTASQKSTITTTANHNLKTGDYIIISNSNSTVSIDGRRQVIVVDPTTFTIETIDTIVTIAGNSGTFVTDPRPSAIISADFDGINGPDLAVTNEGTNDVSIFLNNGAGQFASPINYEAVQSPKAVVSEDFNGDSNLDLAIIGVGKGTVISTGRLCIILGTGGGGFGAPTIITSALINGNFVGITSGDFDGVNGPDLAVALNFWSSAPQFNAVSILQNNGSGTFAYTAENYYFSNWLSGITAAYLNNDAVLDLAVAEFNDNTVGMLLGDGDATFTAGFDAVAGDGPIFIMAADFDSDTKTDLITLNKGQNKFYGYLFPNEPGNNSFSYLRNFYGVKIDQSDRYKFVSEQGLIDTYNIVLSEIPSTAVTITFTYDDTQIKLTDNSDADILNGGDITFTSGNWNVPQTIKVLALDDGDAEGEDYRLISHSASGDAVFAGKLIPDVNVQIADNDQPGVVIHESNNFTQIIENATSGVLTDTYQVVLESEPTANVNIFFTTGDQFSANPLSLTFTPVNWFTPQTVTLTAVQDYYLEGLDLRDISHSADSVDGAYDGIAVPGVEVVILDSNNLPHTPLCLGLMGDLIFNYQINGADLVKMRSWIISASTDYNACGQMDLDGFISTTDLLNLRNYTLANYYHIPEVVVIDSNGNMTDPAISLSEQGVTSGKYYVYLRRKPSVNVYLNIFADSQISLDKNQLIFTNLDFTNTDLHYVTVQVVNDNFIEADPHTSTITHAALSADSNYNAIAVNNVDIAIADNDTAGIVVVQSGGSTDVSETGLTSDTLTIELSADPGIGVIVDVAITTPDGQTTVDIPSLSFDDTDWNTPQIIQVTAVDDSLDENSTHLGRVIITLPNTNPNPWRGTNNLDVNILDNDAPPTISIDDVIKLEGNAGAKLFNFTVSLSAASGMQGSVLYDIADGTATVVNNDYVDFFQDLLVFNPGETDKIISVTVLGDTNSESNETFYINLSGAINATIVDAQGVGTILDDDTAGITVSPISGNTTEAGGTATFTVVLDRQPLGGPATIVSIGLSSSDLSEGTVFGPVFADHLEFTRTNWNVAQTVTVTGVDDSDVDGNISYIIYTDAAVCATDTNFNGLNPPDVAVINIDDETLGGQLVVNAPGDAEPPCQAIDLVADDTIIKAINWNFIDNSADESGFRLYESRSTSEFLIKEVAEPDISQIQENENLETNQAYTRVVKAYNNLGYSNPTDPATCYTLANKPNPVSIEQIGKDSITIKLDQNDGNPAETKYVIRATSGSKVNYVNPDGGFSADPVWYIYEEFNNGLIEVNGARSQVTAAALVDIALNTEENYCFDTQAQNGDGVETEYSESNCSLTQLTTGPNISVIKGVAVNLALHNGRGLFSTAWAGSNLFIDMNGPLSRFLSVLSWLMNIILIVLLVIFGLSLHQTLKFLKHKLNISDTPKLIWTVLSGKAHDSYKNHAIQTEGGVYNQTAYHWHKNLHNISQGTFLGALTIAGLKLLILGTMITSLVNINHSGFAQIAPYNQSGAAIEAGDVLSYIVEINNDGAAVAQNISISDNLNAYLDYVPGSAKINNVAVSDPVGNPLVFSVGNLAANASASLVFKAKVRPGSENENINNQAQISGDNFVTLNSNTTSNRVVAANIPVNGNQNINQPPFIPTNININQPPVIPPAINENISPPLVVPPAGNINQPPIMLPPEEHPPKILIIGQIIEIFNNTKVEQASQNIATPILMAIAIANTLPFVLAFSIYLLPYLHLLFLEPLLALFRKKRKKWGIVYDSLTKLPIDLALVRLYRQTDKKLIQTKVTDREGRYIFVVKETGKYYITLTKPGYYYPTRYLQAEKQDAKYTDLYHGEAIEITGKEAVITANIPMDQAEKRALPIADVIRSYFVKNLRLIVSYIGIILAVLVVIIYPTIFTIGALVLHIILYLLFRKFILPPKPKSWGIIYDEKSKEPLHYAVVRILDTKFNKLLETQVTDSKGRYSFLVGKNEYQLLMEKEGYKKREIKPVDLIKNEEIVNMDVGLQKI